MRLDSIDKTVSNQKKLLLVVICIILVYYPGIGDRKIKGGGVSKWPIQK